MFYVILDCTSSFEQTTSDSEVSSGNVHLQQLLFLPPQVYLFYQQLILLHVSSKVFQVAVRGPTSFPVVGSRGNVPGPCDPLPGDLVRPSISS